MSPVKILAVTSELFPLIKTGGLADVTGALPLALAAENIETTTLVPGYPQVLAHLKSAQLIHTEEQIFGAPARLIRAQSAGLDIIAIDAPHLYSRPGNPYTQPDNTDWPDNAYRFAALALIAARLAQSITAGAPPDIIHAHDWQAGLTPAYLNPTQPRPATLFTVHNLAFQGLFPASLLTPLGLPPNLFTAEAIEFHNQIGFLKSGLALSDHITTVSPTYAAEIQTPESGMNLDGLLRHRAKNLTGILNGIDTETWNPATDPNLPANFSAQNLAPRAANKTFIQQTFALTPSPTSILLGVISRLSWQKGLDLLLDGLDDLPALNAQLALLGAGDRDLEQKFLAATKRHPGRIGAVIGYNEPLAHQLQAGIDALIVPSRFEPCGLTQLCALRYGAIPIVSRTGGLADTVIDANQAALAANAATGLQFPLGQLRPALTRAATLWRQPATWQTIQKNALSANVSWRHPAHQYATLYRSLL